MEPSHRVSEPIYGRKIVAALDRFLEIAGDAPPGDPARDLDDHARIMHQLHLALAMARLVHTFSPGPIPIDEEEWPVNLPTRLPPPGLLRLLSLIFGIAKRW